MKRILVSGLYIVLAMIAAACIIIVGTIDGWFHQRIANQNNSSSFLEAVDTKMSKEFIGNFAIATLKQGEIEYEKFGSVGAAVNRHTVFQVASLSKWISAFGVMKLVEDQKLHLDTPISRYLTRWHLPRSAFDNEEVTVRRLLSHTAGLTDGLGYSGFETTDSVQTLEQSLTKALDADKGISGELRVGIAPGSAFKYSGGGYTLLQLLVEEVSGQSFPLYMNERVFTPLGMTHSSYVWADSAKYSLAEFYNADGTRAKHYYYTSLAATSLYTCIADLELFCQAHLTGKHGETIGRNVLGSEMIEKMREPHGRELGIPIWGLGTVLYATTDHDDYIIGHDGKSTPPINTALRLNPETGDGIIILETGNPSIATRLASEWVFWKVGKVDTFLFPMLIPDMVKIIVTSWTAILAIGIVLSVKMKRRQEV